MKEVRKRVYSKKVVPEGTGGMNFNVGRDGIVWGKETKTK